jgi:hypothetical protein
MGSIVKPSKEMDDALFVRHFNARHTPLAGLAAVHDNMSAGAIAALRAYHKRVHKTNNEDGHEPNHIHRSKEK